MFKYFSLGTEEHREEQKADLRFHRTQNQLTERS